MAVCREGCLEAFECNTTSDCLNHLVKPIRSCLTLKFTKSGEKDKECSREYLVNTDPGAECPLKILEIKIKLLRTCSVILDLHCLSTETLCEKHLMNDYIMSGSDEVKLSRSISYILLF